VGTARSYDHLAWRVDNVVEMSGAAVVWWMRRDLRLADNPAFLEAARAGAVLPLFVVDAELWGSAGDPRKAFLAGALADVDRSSGGHLVVRRGDPATELVSVCDELRASLVIATADYGPYARRRDGAVEAALAAAGVELRFAGSPYAVAPGSVRKGDGSPFRVFTPYSRAWVAHGWGVPLGAPERVEWAERVDGVGIPPAPALSATIPEPGEAAARARFEDFLHYDLDSYGEVRNDPGADRTSRLSAHLHFGCIHPRTLLAPLDAGRRAHGVWRSELCWREFYADVLWQAPASARNSLQPGMAGIRVDTGELADRRFAAWCEGRTGYPIVDAGMRQLAAEAWMHNRVRMIAASFLVKDLHLDWRRGARWFMQHLVDGDLASNNHGWQWVAGTGTDAAPYYRVFNPVLQGRKFDPTGVYVRRYLPELAGVPGGDVHAPWELRQLPFEAGGYPDPIVDHHAERQEALARYGEVRRVG
jgi:deoxyribodipyrimidine photo-lyase